VSERGKKFVFPAIDRLQRLLSLILSVKGVFRF
jgi:hypothetical protein